ncbi:hypothetical protein JCM8097_009217 [Rhodosporidiobolus ruineniae]
MTFRFSGDVSLDNHFNEHLDTYLHYAGLPLPGLGIKLRVGRDGAQFYLGWEDECSTIDLKYGKVVVTANEHELFVVRLQSGTFPPSSTGWLFTDHPGSVGKYDRVHVDLELVTGTVNEPTSPVQERRVLEAVSAVHGFRSSSSDVCLYFPRSGKHLWVSESFSKDSSPYFKQLFSSPGFAESSKAHSASSSTRTFDPYAFDESDEETDKLEVKPKKDFMEVDAPFKTVTITETAYSTYFAVLVWLQSRYIAWAPLYSSFRLDGEPRSSVSPMRISAVTERVLGSDDSLPPPVSPRSVYRLAHLLELDELASLSLDNLRSQLTPFNAAYELYSSVSTCYPAVRDVVLDYAVANWDKVKTAPATEEMEKKAEAGELDGSAAAVAMMLARRLKGR